MPFSGNDVMAQPAIVYSVLTLCEAVSKKLERLKYDHEKSAAP